ncbi:MAG TPA: OadG family protein [bacterium]|nr:OadG family protein [bacterium]HPP88807.1 OadG family protein [bacterium]
MIFIEGLVLTFIGIGLVFLFLTIIYLIVLGFEKIDENFIEKKEVVVNVQLPKDFPEDNLKKLEKMAVLAAAIHYLNNRHPSLVYSETLQDLEIKQLNWFSKKYKD